MRLSLVTLVTLVALVVGLMAPLPAVAQSIDRAYQKEFTYLQAQKSALQKRVTALEQKNSADANADQAALGALQQRLVTLQMRGDTLQEELSEIDREVLRTDEHSESLAAVFEQARASLERYDVDITPPQTAGAADIEALFERAMPVLQEAGTTRTVPGTFFLAGGAKIESQVKHVGRIAAFGEVDGVDIALAPAGDGRLKVWTGAAPGGVFLFESVEKAVEEKAAKSWLGTIEAGGIIAWVIVVLGLVALLLIAWRSMALTLARTPRELVAEACRLVVLGRTTAARRLVTEARGASARVMARTIAVLDEPREVADDVVAQAVLDELPAIDRFGAAIMVFAAVAPLLGLLGTVTGMIATFDIITEYGTGDPKMLSGGISEALITTQLGLMVAIPALLIGNLLNAKAASLVDDLEQSALRVLNAARAEPQPEREESVMFGVDGALLEATG